MFYKQTENNYKELVAGVDFKTLVHGQKTSLGLFKISKGAVIPSHSHPHEQTGFLVRGKMIFNIGDKSHVAETGDSWNIPGNVAHDVEALEDCEVIEVFAPVREDYL